MVDTEVVKFGLVICESTGNSDESPESMFSTGKYAGLKQRSDTEYKCADSVPVFQKKILSLDGFRFLPRMNTQVQQQLPS